MNTEVEGAPMHKGLFRNPWNTWREKRFSDAIRWAMETNKLPNSKHGWLEHPYLSHPTPADLLARFPLCKMDEHAANPPLDAVQALWVGHASVVGRMAGYTFITDPIFSKRCSPVQFAGPTRLVPPSFQIEDTSALPSLDFVLISHNHYDHLDEASVCRLTKRFGASLKWYVPLGLRAWFLKRGIHNVVELDWWQEVQHYKLSTYESNRDTISTNALGLPQSNAADQSSGLSVTLTPSQHWSARGIFDRFKTLWGGYLVRSQDPCLSFWFAGDTGYCDVFKEIGKRFGPIDVSAIPVGAYEPRWFMKAEHVNPEEALQIHHDVQSRQSLGIHCCTFALSSEALDAPPRRLLEAQTSQGLDASKFIVVKHGEYILMHNGKLSNSPQQIQ